LIVTASVVPATVTLTGYTVFVATLNGIGGVEDWRDGEEHARLVFGRAGRLRVRGQG
jgi:hypothetical protein